MSFSTSTRSTTAPPKAYAKLYTETVLDIIDAMIKSLKVGRAPDCEADAVPRAAIVTEHRNLKELLAGVARESGKEDWAGVFVVMTGEMPCLATREFLHMLGTDKYLEGVPFLFISDHDVHAAEIFSVLKHGSRATAWAYNSTICPRLVWAGVSLDCYEQLASAWPDWEMDKRIKAHACRKEDREEELDRLRKTMERKFWAPLKMGKGSLNTSDVNIMTHVHRYGSFSERYDGALYKDLRRMGMNEPGAERAVAKDALGLFSLAKLGDPMIYGVENCMLWVMKQHGVREAVNSQIQLPEWSPARARWLEARSSYEPALSTSQQPQSADDMRMLSEQNLVSVHTSSSSQVEDMQLAVSGVAMMMGYRDVSCNFGKVMEAW